MTVGQILSHSSNVGAVTLAELVGSTRLSEWISRFGFGRKTGIDFPGESSGIVLPRHLWSGSTIGTVPIGQGIAVTPIQLAAAYAAVANHGILVTPHLVDHIVGSPRPRVAQASRALVVHRSAGAVDARERRRRGHGDVCGRPGLRGGRKDRDGCEARSDQRRLFDQSSTWRRSSGSCLRLRPRLVILVTVDEPHGAIWGGTVAAPIFSDIAHFALQYMQVPPDNPAELQTTSSSG